MYLFTDCTFKIQMNKHKNSNKRQGKKIYITDRGVKVYKVKYF